MKLGLREGFAAVAAVVAISGAADGRAQEATPIIPDPDVRAAACKIRAEDVTFRFVQDETLEGVPPTPVTANNVRTATYVECMRASPPPTPAEKRRGKCAEVADRIRDFLEWQLKGTPNSADTSRVADSAAAAAEDKCLANEEQAARARCSQIGGAALLYPSAYNDALEVAGNHERVRVPSGRDAAGIGKTAEATCLANEGLKP